MIHITPNITPINLNFLEIEKHTVILKQVSIFVYVFPDFEKKVGKTRFYYSLNFVFLILLYVTVPKLIISI